MKYTYKIRVGFVLLQNKITLGYMPFVKIHVITNHLNEFYEYHLISYSYKVL